MKKKKINVIQINGIKGIIMAVFIGSCLIAGFVGFPGLVAMYIWNHVASYLGTIPQIGLFQGILLWAIIVASYFVFRKEKLIVCMKAPQGLSDEELKSVFADIKKQTQSDTIIQAMMKAQETELKLKETQEQDKASTELK